jgi:hypothetical protein
MAFRAPRVAGNSGRWRMAADESLPFPKWLVRGAPGRCAPRRALA